MAPVLTTTETYHTFSDVTRWSFRHAAAEQGIKMTPEVEDHVMEAYNGLDTFPDADAGLTLLADSPSVDPFIFSNGTKSMLTSSMSTSPALSKASRLLPTAKVISVEPLKVFKPDPAVYQHLVKVAGKENDPGSVWLVSSNPFDVCGAVTAGLKSVWVDRTGLGWVDGLANGTGDYPTLVAQGVDEAVREIMKRSGSN